MHRNCVNRQRLAGSYSLVPHDFQVLYWFETQDSNVVTQLGFGTRCICSIDLEVYKQKSCLITNASFVSEGVPPSSLAISDCPWDIVRVECDNLSKRDKNLGIRRPLYPYLKSESANTVTAEAETCVTAWSWVFSQLS